MEPLIPLFWTSGDVCPGFQSWLPYLQLAKPKWIHSLACLVACAQRIPLLTLWISCCGSSWWRPAFSHLRPCATGLFIPELIGLPPGDSGDILMGDVWLIGDMSALIGVHDPVWFDARRFGTSTCFIIQLQLAHFTHITLQTELLGSLLWTALVLSERICFYSITCNIKDVQIKYFKFISRMKTIERWGGPLDKIVTI